MPGRGAGWLIPILAAAATAAAQVTVPFVGCETSGHVGLAAPRGSTPPLPISDREALALAYYKPDQSRVSVLAPRGWRCHYHVGSGGNLLVVRPDRSEKSEDLNGPAILVALHHGDSSGRLTVAKRIARIFPKYRAFVDDVRALFDLPASEFPVGPFATDTLKYRDDRSVLFQTPAGAEGLGTQGWLKKNDDPIDGISILVGTTPDLFELSVRLPAELRWLAPVIIRHADKNH